MRVPATARLGLSVLAAALIAAAAAQRPLAAERMVVIGTAPVAGVYYPAGGAICRLVNARRAEGGLRCLVESTDGSAENLRRLQSGDLDFALVQSDWQYHAFRGNGGDEPFDSLRAVLSLHAQALTVVASRESGVERFEDLKGKRVNLGPPGSALRAVTEVLVQGLGWTGDDFAEVSGLGADEQVDALCAGLIDAFILPVSHPNGVVATATEGCLAKLVGVDGEAVDRLVADWPFYDAATIPGGLYRGNPEPVPSFGVRATLVARAETPEETVYQLVAAVFEGLESLRRQHPAFAALEGEAMASEGNSAPIHDGALRYYRERGWRE